MVTRWPHAEHIPGFEPMDNLLAEFMGSLPTAGFHPVVDIKADEKEYTIIAELPGVHEEDVTVELTGEMLVLSGKRETDLQEQKGAFIRRERMSGTFRRTFHVGPHIRPEEITATFMHGELVIRVPRKSDTPTRRVTVRRG